MAEFSFRIINREKSRFKVELRKGGKLEDK
jgi:hypothetical protein